MNGEGEDALTDQTEIGSPMKKGAQQMNFNFTIQPPAESEKSGKSQMPNEERKSEISQKSEIPPESKKSHDSEKIEGEQEVREAEGESSDSQTPTPEEQNDVLQEKVSKRSSLKSNNDLQIVKESRHDSSSNHTPDESQSESNTDSKQESKEEESKEGGFKLSPIPLKSSIQSSSKSKSNPPFITYS